VECSATQPDESCIRVKISTPLIRLRARNQGLNEGHFDRFLSHFRAALDEVDVETDKVEKVTKLLESKRCAESLRIFLHGLYANNLWNWRPKTQIANSRYRPQSPT